MQKVIAMMIVMTRAMAIGNDDDVIVKDEDLNETPTATTPLPELLGRGMRIRKRPTPYVPSTTGKKYELGVMNVCFRGTRYKLKDGVISVNVDPVVHRCRLLAAQLASLTSLTLMLRSWD